MILRRSIILLSLVCLVALGVFHALIVNAEDYTSGSFILRNPVISIEGGNSTSTTFTYYSSSGQLSSAETSSAGFIQRAGFLYFPTATTPIISATPGTGEVSLGWTASTPNLTPIDSYSLGFSTVSGGPYTYESVGVATTFLKTGLTGGTTYYFVIRVNGSGEILAESAQVASTPTAVVVVGVGGGSGGGGGGGRTVTTGVEFSGKSYPLSKVTILRDGQVSASTIAGPDAQFKVTLTGLTAGNYSFSVFGEDSRKNKSSPFSFSVMLTSGVVTSISGIFIAPTIAVDKKQVKQGDDISIFGQSVPKGSVTIGVASTEVFRKTTADKDGVYLYNFDTAPLELGKHETRSKVAYNREVSPFSRTIGFVVGTETTQPPVDNCGKADLNCDGKVNLVDYSIGAYWDGRELSSDFAAIEKVRLNGDGRIDLVDFSIMAFYWTG